MRAEENESSIIISSTTAAAAAVGWAEAGDTPARNCGTAAAVFPAAAIRQGEEHTHWHWIGEVMTTDSRFLIFTSIRSSHQQRRRRGGGDGGLGSFGDGAVV